MLAPSTTRANIINGRSRAAKRRVAQLGYELVPIPDGQDQAPGVPLTTAATGA